MIRAGEEAARHLTTLVGIGSPKQAEILQRFFKTGEGEYGFGDIFLGIKMPTIRAYEQQNRPWDTDVLHEMLGYPEHDMRALALIALVNLYKKAGKDTQEKKRFFDFYVTHFEHINNWDLVDITCPHIVGNYLSEVSPTQELLLDKWAESNRLWTKRIAVVSTLGMIRQNYFVPTLRICTRLLFDKHDLIQKANGWMLREMGKRNEQLLLDYLEQYAHRMPRITLRYALEKLDAETQKDFMQRSRK